MTSNKGILGVGSVDGEDSRDAGDSWDTANCAFFLGMIFTSLVIYTLCDSHFVLVVLVIIFVRY
jgi:hypothetical protein